MVLAFNFWVLLGTVCRLPRRTLFCNPNFAAPELGVKNVLLMIKCYITLRTKGQVFLKFHFYPLKMRADGNC
jgi:hypothetical protein